ncbi:MAG: hypothetical protein R3B70_03950 [Polyangiaceae bacterium]
MTHERAVADGAESGCLPGEHSAVERRRVGLENRAFLPAALRRRGGLSSEEALSSPSTRGLVAAWVGAISLLACGVVLVGRYVDLWAIVRKGAFGE